MEHTHFKTSIRTFLLFISAILFTITGGAFMGIITAFVASFFYIVLLFPFAMGIASGTVVRAAVEMAKVRGMVQLILLSAVAAISLYGMYHYGRYFALQLETSLEMFDGLTSATNGENFKAAQAVVDHSLEEATGKPGFVGYMLHRAQQGLSIGRIARSSRLHLGPTLTWLYFLVEFVMILWVTILVSRKDVLVPVCDSCGSRYGKEKHLGGTSGLEEATVMGLLQQRDFVELGKFMEANAALPSVEFYAQSCERCGQGSIQLSVRRAFTGARGKIQFKDIRRIVLPLADHTLLLRQLTYIVR